MKRIYRYSALILAVIGILTVFFAFQLPRAELDNNNFRFISPDDPARKTMAWIDDTFGSSLFILVGLKRSSGDVFDAAFLEKVRDYVDRIEEIEIIDPVTSIVSADYITGADGAIFVDKLLPGDFSGSPEEIAALKQRLLSWDIYQRALISDDFTATQLLVPMNVSSEDAGKREVIDRFIQVRDIAREMFAGDADVYVTGIPVISATINEAVRSDLRLLVPLVVVVVLLILFFSFRRAGAVILPLLTVVIAAIWSVGAMPLFNVKLSVISTVLPVILVAVGSAYGIHVITHYREEMAAKKALNRKEHADLVLAVTRKIKKPVLLAALTTFAGFSSFCFTTVLPIREFGFFASFGVLASFAVAMTMIPALLIVRGPSAPGTRREQAGESAGIGRFFTALALRKKTVLASAAVLALVSVYGAAHLIIDNVFIEYFRSDTDISKSDRFIREEFGGSKIVSVVAEADSYDKLLSPENLAALDALNAYLAANVPETGKTMGFTDLIKRVNLIFNAEDSENPEDSARYYEIPSEPAKYGMAGSEELTRLIANYLIFLSGSVDSYANDPLEPTAIKTTVQLRTLGESDTARGIAEIRRFIGDNFPPDLRITIGGSALVEASLNRQVVRSQLVSVLISLALVFIIIAVSNASLAGGLAGIVPLSISILINFAVMGFLGIKLNIGTSMIASLAVGIGIDYTIHYMEAFKREIAELGITGLAALDRDRLREFLGKTFAVSGKAIIINAVSVGAGFAVLVFSRFIMLADFGLLIALTMGISALVSLTVIPALLLVFKPAFVYPNKKRYNGL
jgi:hydrophobe/amphiphile efflux-3 (HAE3) family protein